MAGCRDHPNIRSNKSITESHSVPEQDDVGVSIDKTSTCGFLQGKIEDYLESRVREVGEELRMRLPEVVVCDERRISPHHPLPYCRKSSCQ